MTAPAPVFRPRSGFRLEVIGPRMRVLLLIIFALVALLFANSAYLSSITFMGWLHGEGATFEDPFYIWMFLLHVLMGLLLIVPLVLFGVLHWRTARKLPNRRAMRMGQALFITSLVVIVTGVLLVRFEGFPDIREQQTRLIVYWAHVIGPLVCVWLYILHRLAGPPIRWKVGLGWAGIVGVVVAGMVALHAQDPREWNVRGPESDYWDNTLARTASGNLIDDYKLTNNDYCLQCHEDVHARWIHSAHRFSSFNNPAYLNSAKETRKVLKARDDAPDYYQVLGVSKTATSEEIAVAHQRLSAELDPAKYPDDKEKAHAFAQCEQAFAVLSDGEEKRLYDLYGPDPADPLKHFKASRFCAGCHDPVPLFSGAFSDPNYDLEKDPTAHEGITCTVCHAITNVNSVKGNGAYTIEEPLHYPFAFSDNPILKYLNRQLIKAKPSFHKKTFLKPLHKTEEFCSTCHKVHLPESLNAYKWLRGQNHYDPFILSGVSGGGAMSFYYPPQAKNNCNDCHMPLLESDDFAAKHFDPLGPRTIHDHLFPAANTAVAHWKGEEHKERIVAEHQKLLKDCLRVDIFALRQGENLLAEPVHAPLRPEFPRIQPGKSYILEVVIRTLTLGHHFTQGTADSNEAWVELSMTAGDRVIGRSGAIDDHGQVDPWSYFLNAYVLDRRGERIDRRNAQDIFVPLYNHQIPPGAARVVRYKFTVPEGLTGPITIDAKVRYRKFDLKYMKIVFGEDYQIDLPITDICSDRLVLGIEGGPDPPAQAEPKFPLWQRWNDYGIGQLIEADDEGAKSADLRGAIWAFEKVEKLKQPDGPLNLARTYLKQGSPPKAEAALRRVAEFEPLRNPWTLAWLGAEVDKAFGEYDRAAAALQDILENRYPGQRKRGFDFSRDYRLHNLLGTVLYEKASAMPGDAAGNAEKQTKLRVAAASFERSLQFDPENLAAHYNLYLVYRDLADKERAAEHQQFHDKYRIDDNARDKVFVKHRSKYPAADHAANPGAIYDLQREPGMPALTGNP